MRTNSLRRASAILMVVGLVVGGALLPGRAGAATPTPTGTVDWNDVRQEIDGFGASGAFGQAAAILKLPEPARTEVFDLLFDQDTGIGLSLVRNRLPIISSAPGVYDFTKDGDQIELMRQARARGTTQFLSTVWSPPRWMKDNNDFAHGGQVSPQYWPLYADYLAEYVLKYKELFGIDITAVSPANEPDAATNYESSIWNGNQLRDFTKYFLAPVWAQKGVAAKYVIPETSYWSEDRAVQSLQDPDTPGFPSAGKRVDVVAAHGYGQDNPPAPLAVSKAAGKHIWETETSELGSPDDPSITNGLFWAKRVHTFLTGPEVNLFNSWWLAAEKRFDPDPSKFTREGLINLQTQTEPYTYQTTKRLFALGNYSRFVRPGWVRIGAADATSPVTAFRDPGTGRFAFVLINEGAAATKTIALSGFQASSVTPYTTSATQNLAAGAPITVAQGTITASLPAKSVTTLVGTGTPTTPLSVKVTGGKVWSGESLPATLTVRNTGPNAVSGTADVAATPLTSDPPSVGFSLAPGASTDLPITLGAPATATAGTVPVIARARVDGAAADAIGVAAVTVATNQVTFRPGTPAEEPWMLQGGSGVDGGGARYADANAKTIYRFDLPADTAGGTIALDIDNQFDVATSVDGATYTSRFTESRDNPIPNRAVRTIDLDVAREGGQTVFVRIGDSKPADGNGGRLWRLTLDVVRSGESTPVVPEARVGVLLPLTGGAALLIVDTVRRRRRHAAEPRGQKNP